MNRIKLLRVESGVNKANHVNLGPLTLLHPAINFICFGHFFSCIPLYLFVFSCFFSPPPFRCVLSGSHHSGSPLARGARYCMSADSSKVYTIPQTSGSGTGPEPVPRPGSGLASEACGQTRAQAACELGTATAAGDDEDDAHSSEGPPNISECG